MYTPQPENNPQKKIPTNLVPLPTTTSESELIESAINVKNDSDKPFPLEVFPEGLAEDIKELERGLNYPVAFSALAAIMASAVAIGKAAVLRIRVGFEVKPIFYGIVIGQPGVGKTHPLKAFVKPLRNIERERREKWTTDMSEHKIKVSEAKAAKEDPPEDKLGPKPLMVTTDATLEALGILLGNNKECGTLLFADEARTWLDTGRYKSGSDDAHWLSLFEGSPLSITRVGRDNLFVPNPSVCVLGGIQPDVLADVTAGGKKGTGFLGRILFIFPTGLKSKPLSVDDTDPLIPQRWETCVRHLHNLYTSSEDVGSDNTSTLKFSPEAISVFHEFESENCEAINDANEAGRFTESEQLSKLLVHSYKLALVLRLLWWAWEDPRAVKPTSIDADTARRAVLLTKYFRESAEKVRNHLGDDSAAGLTAKERSFFQGLESEFTTSQAIEQGERAGLQKRKVQRCLRAWTDPKMGLLEKLDHGKYRKRAKPDSKEPS